MKIGFVGLGKMGTGIARSLIHVGHNLTVYNRTPQKTEALVKEGAIAASSPAEAARDAEAVFTMLSDDHALQQVVLGPNGIASALREGAVHISSSTISVALSKKLETEHAFLKQEYIAATVFGRPDSAEHKKLIVVAAGEPAILGRFLPLLDAIGRCTFQVGAEPWRANAVKLCGNSMLASMLETFSEAFTTIAKAGIERQTFLDVMNELWGSPVYQNYGKAIVDRKFEGGGGFDLSLGLKDVRLALELAQEVAAPMPIASLVRDHLLSAVANGQAQMDVSSIELVLARSAGLDAGTTKESVSLKSA
jgi:3-hydroxyisobutyrate dehydrogenase-like beta-hydroxyacid dehydrogenase